MSKISLGKIVKKAKNAVQDGIEGAEVIARIVTDGIGDGIENARDSIQDSVLASNATKELKECINTLEEHQKAVSEEKIKESIETVISDLKSLIKDIRKDPADSLSKIDVLVNSIRQSISELSEGKNSSGELFEQQIMSKCYNKAVEACLNSSQIIEDSITEEKEKSEEAAKKKIIVQPKGTDIKLLIPEGYEKAKYRNPVKGLKYAIANDEIAISKVTNRSKNIVVINNISANNAMGFDKKQQLIDGIHEILEDNQGLIEVESGKTKRGYDYIYSIVKSVKKDVGGAEYYLRLQIGNEVDLIEIQSVFEEYGITGERDSFCSALAQRAGLVSFGEDGLVGWWEDPYDPEYTKGIPMNLSERPALDALFPEHPLSQARELLAAIIKDEHVLPKANDNSEEKDRVFEDYKENDKQFYFDLFAKDSKLVRPTVEIEVE